MSEEFDLSKVPEDMRHLFEDVEQKDPDIELAMDLGRHAAEEARIAIMRVAKNATDPIEASVATILAAHLVLSWARKGVETSAGDTPDHPIHTVWRSIELACAGDEEALAELVKATTGGA